MFVRKQFLIAIGMKIIKIKAIIRRMTNLSNRSRKLVVELFLREAQKHHNNIYFFAYFELLK